MKQTSILDFKKSKEPIKTSVKVKKSNGGGEEPKKVDKAPEGFVQFKKEGNKTFFKKIIPKTPYKLDPAIARTPGKLSTEEEKNKYFNKMVDMVKSGIDPKDLVDKKYIDPSFVVKLQPYFKPTASEEIVFTEDTTPNPPSTPPAPPATPPMEKPSYVINVRGDEPGGKGAYYFPTKENFDKIQSLVPQYKSYQRKTGRGDATYDMNHDVFLDYHVKNNPEILNALGKPYLRDPKNPDNFIEKK